ncbi:hypothetical protein OG432_14035 [Streptomyces sp. NBC_00442]|uniref:hypothetical protein n=1 Tax=Streptomyces sp. NBC_00442 TaxID=2903651 RepID=UPI002E1A29F1
MRSPLRIVAAVATLLVLGSVAAPGAAYAESGDRRVAQMRLRVVEAVNQGTLGEIERVRACAGEDLCGEVARLEAKLRDGCRLAADLRHVRGVVRHRAVPSVPVRVETPVETGARGAGWTPGGADVPAEPAEIPAEPAGGSAGAADASTDGSADASAEAQTGVSTGLSDGASAGGGEAGGEETVFQAARSAVPHTPVGVLCVLSGGGLALVGGGLAAAAVRRPGTGATRRLYKRG